MDALVTVSRQRRTSPDAPHRNSLRSDGIRAMSAQIEAKLWTSLAPDFGTLSGDSRSTSHERVLELTAASESKPHVGQPPTNWSKRLTGSKPHKSASPAHQRFAHNRPRASIWPPRPKLHLGTFSDKVRGSANKARWTRWKPRCLSWGAVCFGHVLRANAAEDPHDIGEGCRNNGPGGQQIGGRTVGLTELGVRRGSQGRPTWKHDMRLHRINAHSADALSCPNPSSVRPTPTLARKSDVCPFASQSSDISQTSVPVAPKLAQMRARISDVARRSPLRTLDGPWATFDRLLQ